MKKIIITFLMVMLVATVASADDKKIGLSFGVDYMSDYQWRGTTFYGGAGALFPFISYNIAGSGLEVSYIGEYGDNFLEDGYTSTAAYQYQSADFGLAYSIEVPKIMKINLSGAFLWYYMSKSFQSCGVDDSFFSASVAFVFDSILLSPTLTYTHDFYIDNASGTRKNLEDFYIQLGISHSFEVAKGVSLDLGLTGGLFHNVVVTAVDWRVDLDFSAGLSVAVGDATFTGGFDVIVIPTAGVANGDKNYLKMLAKFGASYAL
jgi:hypothetical protein